jgi:hypothetical protein
LRKRSEIHTARPCPVADGPAALARWRLLPHP